MAILLKLFLCVLYVNGNFFANAQEQTQSEERSCGDVQLPQKPDFSEPGRRISEIKCLETKWEINYREEQEKHCPEQETTDEGTNDAFPHTVILGWKDEKGTLKFLCGGTLISAKFVMTAALCVRSKGVKSLPEIVRLNNKLGDDYKNWKGYVDINISKIIVHPNYENSKTYSDIALLELERDVEFNKKIHPACLWLQDNENSLNSEGYIFGWNLFKEGAERYLSKAQVKLMDPKTCESLLQPVRFLKWLGPEYHICTNKAPAEACQGGAGGALSFPIELSTTSKWVLHYAVGITEFGPVCGGNATQPDVYTKVARYLDWIEENVWKN